MTSGRFVARRIAGLVAIVLAGTLCACSYQVTTQVPPEPGPSAPLPVGVDPSAQLEGGKDVAEAVLEVSRGTIGRLDGQPLRLTSGVTAAKAKQNSVLIGVGSFFLPFLAFVPESFTDQFTAVYAVSDRSNRVVYRNSVDVKVDGTMKGWYIARINARQGLIREAGKYAARAIARTIVEDLVNHREVLAGGAAPPPATAPSGQPKPVSGAEPPAEAAPWWKQ